MTEELVRWDVKLHCRGYYGFGGGYAATKGYKYGDEGELYCNVCPTADACYKEHKRVALESFPALVKEFECRADTKSGPELVEEWFKEFHGPDPYTALNAGNIEDGMAVGLGLQPHDRGPYTLAWPLVRRGD